MEENTYVIEYGTTTEKQMRAAIHNGSTLMLEPPEGTDTENVPCSSKAGDALWLRLLFKGARYTYVYDNAWGWSYRPNAETEASPEITDSGAVEQELAPDKNYKFSGDVTSLEVSFAGDANAHYHFSFLSGSPAATLTLPADVVMPDGFQVEVNKRYEIDILDGYASAQGWSR